MNLNGLRALLIFAFASVAAWGSISYAAEKEFTGNFHWTSVRGNAEDLAVGFDGSAFSVDAQGQVWLRRMNAEHWLKLPGSLLRVDAVNERDAWGIGLDGAVFHFNGTLWRRLPDVTARDVGAGKGVVLAVMDDGSLARYLAPEDRFVAVKDAPPDLSRVDVDDHDHAWVVLENGGSGHYDGSRWMIVPTRLQEIAAGADQGAFAVSADHRLMRWNSRAGRWDQLSASAASVAIDADGSPWLATPSGEIFVDKTAGTTRRAVSTNPSQQVLTQILAWRKVNGDASALAISADGQVAALGPQGEIWLWKGVNSWSRLPGNFRRLALAADGRPWAIDTDGEVRQFVGSRWLEVHVRASDIAAGADGSVWIIGQDGKLARWIPAQNEWRPLASTSTPKAVRLAIDPQGHPWIIDSAGLVQRHDGKSWENYPGIEASDLAIGPEATVFAVAANKPWRYNRLEKRWRAVSGEAKAIAVGPRGLPWAITPQSEIIASSFFESERSPSADVLTVGSAAAPLLAGSSTQATSKEPLDPSSFVRVRNFVARNIAIGGDGSVFAINFEGKLARWSNTRNSFVAFPGEFRRIAVSSDGTPWGVNAIGEVFRHDGIDWRVVRDILAQDIGIGGNGTVIVAGTDEVLHRFNQESGRFERLAAEREGDPPPTGSRVAVGPNGRPWTIDRKNRLYRCDRIACELLPQSAISLAIGPEGSVFIVDPNRRLRRYNRASDAWDSINVDAESVAAGPAGRPWITNARNELWASRFFTRNESGDLVSAATSSGKTTTSPAPVFTFLVNIPFDTVAQPVGFNGNPFPPVLITFKPNGQTVIVDSNRNFWNYDQNRKALVRDMSIPSPTTAQLNNNDIRSFAVAPDGVYWISTDNSSGAADALRLKGSQWVTVPGIRDCTSTPGCTFTGNSASVSVGANGEIFATSTGGNILRYDPTQQRFVKTSIPRPNGGAQKVSVDPNGRLWAASNGDNRINEFDGKVWIIRSGTNFASTAACRTANRPCVSIGANGAVYAVNSADNRLVRWNPLGNSWDRITSSPNILTDGFFAVGPDGRPWVWTSTIIQKAR